MNVIFATCDHKPLLTADDQLLADALSARGVSVTPIPWTELDPFAVVDAPAIVIRSTWDYHRVPTMFSAWLQSLADSGRMVWNPPDVTLGNIDKIYLKRLEAAGVAIPQTSWLDRPDAQSIDSVMNERGWSAAVLKPRIAATAYGTFLINQDSVLCEEDLAPGRASGALLQELVPEVVARGEASLVYLDGVFSHAVIKQAKADEFRVQQDFGGRVEPATPSATLVEFADRVVDTIPPGWLYARVDLVEARRGPLLMELELIEPELYFLYAPAAADRLARLLVDRLRP